MAKHINETHTEYHKPHRPLPVALFNTAGKMMNRTGLSARLSVEKMTAKAKQKTDLTDFGDKWFFEPLQVLVDSINREADLTPFGKFIQKTRLESLLVTRLRIEELLTKHPEIMKIDLGKTIFIAGLQRTGTTTLHRLIASDPDMRALISWEALNPVPLPGEKPEENRKRVKVAKTAERSLAYIAPDFFAIHPVEHQAPEEDVLLLDLSFMSQSAEAVMHVPTYAAWLEKQDHTRAYEYLRTVLKILLWQQPARNWVLKSPHHMEYLDVILKVFPEAYIVQTHRDPQKTTASFCSMVSHGRGVFSDAVDPKEVARHWIRKVSRLMERSIKVREKHPESSSRFIDISYYDLLKNPLLQVKKIYDFTCIELNDRALQSMNETSTRDVQHRYGRHVYRMEDFDLSREKIEAEHGFYRDKYAIPFE